MDPGIKVRSEESAGTFKCQRRFKAEIKLLNLKLRAALSACETKLLVNVVLTHKRSKRMKRRPPLNVREQSICPRVNIPVGSPSPGCSAAVASISPVMSAPSALQPPLPALHLLLPFSLCLPSPSRCQQVWSDWHRKTAVWLLLVGSLTDPLHSRFSLSFALQSLVIPARLICYPPPPAPPSLKTLRGSRGGLRHAAEVT